MGGRTPSEGLCVTAQIHKDCRTSARTQTELARPHAITVISDDRSFCRFGIRWAFSPQGDDHCHVDFSLDCATRSLFLAPVVEMLVLPMAVTMVAVFEARAHTLAAPADQGLPDRGAGRP